MNPQEIPEEIIDDLYSFFGGNDYFEDDEEIAVELAQERHPYLNEQEILKIFRDFLDDNQDECF